MDEWILFLTGLAGGFLAGFLGIGGGIIYVLVLPAILGNFNIPYEYIAQYTIANSIFGILFASLSGTVTQIINKNFYWKEVTIVSLSSGIAALAVLNWVVNTSWYSNSIFNVILLVILIVLFLETIISAKEIATKEVKSPFLLGSAGFGSGVLSALSGLGGGAILIPVLKNQLKIGIKKSKSISLSMIFFTSFFISVANIIEKPLIETNASAWGLIVLPIALPLSLGVAISSPLGVKVGERVKDYYINLVLGLFLLVVIVVKIFKVAEIVTN